MKNKTIPWSEVADGVSEGVIGVVAVGVDQFYKMQLLHQRRAQ